MKIAVVSTGRSRCTLLAKYLHVTHPDLEFCGEYYGDAFMTQEKNSTDLELVDITNTLLSKENYIVKIMGINLIHFEINAVPAAFKLEEYDEIHLVERHDFFQQCCSWQVAGKRRIYHSRVDNPTSEQEDAIMRNHKYNLGASGIKAAAKFVDCYLQIKKYIIDHNLPYTLHTYESAKQFDKKQNELVDSKLEYEKMITNYHLKEAVNNLFNQHFSYSEMTSDHLTFTAALDDIKGLRSIQSFANKMAAKWNK